LYRDSRQHLDPLFVQSKLVKGTVFVRDDYLKQAQQIIPDPNILINVVSRRAKQLKFGNKPLVESLEKLDAEDIALREVIEGKISYILAEEDEE
jgi:DNA-directed RNA polymerase subunit omega